MSLLSKEPEIFSVKSIFSFSFRDQNRPVSIRFNEKSSGLKDREKTIQQRWILSVCHFTNVASDPTAASDSMFRSVPELKSADCRQTCERLRTGRTVSQSGAEMGGSGSHRAGDCGRR
jgi:hypothetical protein